MSVSDWADWISILGLPITLFGLWQAYSEAKKSKSAAESARMAAEQAREALFKGDALGDLSFVLSSMNSIKNYIRTGTWVLISPTATEARSRLIKSRAYLNHQISQEEMSNVQKAIQTLRQIEEKVDMHTVRSKNIGDPIPMIVRLSEDADDIQSIIEKLRGDG